MSVCTSVTYISSLSIDARKKKLVHWLEEFLAKDSKNQISNFCLEAWLLNFAVFTLIFDAGNKMISAFDRTIPCQGFLIRFLKFCLGAEIYMFKVV